MARMMVMMFILFLASCQMFAWLNAHLAFAAKPLLGSSFTTSNICAGALFLTGFSLYLRKK